MIKCPYAPCEWCEILSHLYRCERWCCTNGDGCDCGRPGPHGCEIWIDDQEHPAFVEIRDPDAPDERMATCGPCREAVAHAEA